MKFAAFADDAPQACEHLWVHEGDAKNLRQTCMRCRAPRPALTRYPAGIEFRDAERAPERQHIEQRFSLTELVIADAESRTFEGYGCRFDVRDSYNTVFLPGCFAESLADWRSQRAWPSFYLQHDWDMIIGGWNDMYEDKTGLFVRGDFLNSAWGEHGRALVKEKRARGLSIGFVAVEWEIREAEDGTRVRYIKKADLWEVSLVERAAVPGSAVTAIRADMSVREVEQALETMGAPRTWAKLAASQWKGKGGEGRDAPAPTADELRDAAEAEAAEAQARDAQAEAEQRQLNQDLAALVQATTRSLARS